LGAEGDESVEKIVAIFVDGRVVLIVIFCLDTNKKESNTIFNVLVFSYKNELRGILMTNLYKIAILIYDSSTVR
jgi:hypothetical protein